MGPQPTSLRRCCMALTISRSGSPTLIMRPGKGNDTTLPSGVLTRAVADMVARLFRQTHIRGPARLCTTILVGSATFEAVILRWCPYVIKLTYFRIAQPG